MPGKMQKNMQCHEILFGGYDPFSQPSSFTGEPGWLSWSRSATMIVAGPPADPITPTSAPRVITGDQNAASAMKEPTTPADPTPTKSAPRVINVDKNAAYPNTIADLKAAGILPESVELRQVKYLNNLVEQDHRFIKRLVKPGLGFFSLESAERTLHGYEAMHMIRT